MAGLAAPQPEVRRWAAIALGRAGDRAALQALAQALEREADGEVRASLILALGAIDGEDALQRLAGQPARSEAEALALAKVRDRAREHDAPHAEWRENLALADIFLETPAGLERLVGRMLVKEGYPPSVVAGEKLLRFSEPVAIGRLTPLPREVVNLRIALADVATPERANADQVVDQLVARGAARPGFADWFRQADALRFRFSVEGVEAPREELLGWMARVRAGFEVLGMADSPSAYNCELILAWSDQRAILFFRPRFGRDERFAYRKRSGPAAISPVVAAGLARLVNADGQGVVVDPTCGSATLLIERAFVDANATLVGLDIDAAAIAAASENAAAAGFGERAQLICADARDPAAWPACALVIANLPFGIRSARRDPDLAGLYSAILRNAAARLSQRGRIVLASANRRALESAVASEQRAVTILARHHYVSGGLMVQVMVLGLR